MQREDLLRLLYPEPEQNHKNDDHAKEHDDPKSHDPEDVGVEVPEDTEEDGA
jgi:hypothetical protein